MFRLLEPRRILLVVVHGKRRMKQKKFNIFNSVFCCNSAGLERIRLEVREYSNSVFLFCRAFWQSGVQALDTDLPNSTSCKQKRAELTDLELLCYRH